MEKVFLVCNAHLDPIWLWEWEEGAAEALSTFRIAAGFCEKYDGFVFNHNEAILYQWIQEYDPDLFARIQSLVRQGKWHIMGGWFLQPDCNMPNGESFVRQILTGRNYFQDHFGVRPTTAINFDPFGHTRGLVQILRKSGYDSYVICRPGFKGSPMPAADFVWLGLDDSAVMVHSSAMEGYNSVKNHVDEKYAAWLAQNKDKPYGLFLWGIGNHGGGPSRIDMQLLQEIMANAAEGSIVHATPEAYFAEVEKDAGQLPRCAQSLNPFADGCYTSQIRVKQKHRLLENDLYLTEKMASSAALQGYLPYPQKELDAALYDLMTAEFHDALPGSAIQPVEEATLRLLDHGLELVSRVRARAFFALSSGQPPVADGETPLLIYNPHPYSVNGVMECEFVIPAQNWDTGCIKYPVMLLAGKPVPCQLEKEYSNFGIDWRKHVSFDVELEPSRMNRFDFRFIDLPQKPQSQVRAENGVIRFQTEELDITVNCSTGLVDRFLVRQKDYLKENAFQPLVIQDHFSPWGGPAGGYREIAGKFDLMSAQEGSRFSGLQEHTLEPVRVIEDGEVRTVIEALFRYQHSSLCMYYKLPKHGTEVHLQIKVFWNEKDKMLKLSIPTFLQQSKYLGQTAFGIDDLKTDGSECVAQKWTGVFCDKDDLAVSCVNSGTYGSSCADGEIRPTLLRSPAYSAGNFPGRAGMETDRFTPRMDQGERIFDFWINCGSAEERLATVDQEALARNEKPFALSYCPSGEGKEPLELIRISDAGVQLSAFKKAEKSQDYILRLYESTGREREAVVCIPLFGVEQTIAFHRFEVKTFRLRPAEGTLVETGMLEENSQD